MKATSTTPTGSMSDYEDIDSYSRTEPGTGRAIEESPYETPWEFKHGPLSPASSDDAYSHLRGVRHSPVENPYDSSPEYAHLHDAPAQMPENDYGRLPAGISALPARSGRPAGLRRESIPKPGSNSDYEDIDFRRSGRPGIQAARPDRPDRPESSPYATLDESQMNTGKLKRQNAIRRHRSASPPPLPPRKGGSVSSE